MSSVYEISGAAPVAAANADVRAAFITRTYMHLFGAILGFTAIEMFFFSSGLAESIARSMLSVSWLFVLGGFIVVSWLASRLADSATSPAAQYAGLAGFVIAEALIFVPMLYIADSVASGVIESAALVTLMGFTALTILVHRTRRDFSFLAVFLRWAFIGVLVLIVAGVMFGFELGTYFSVGMVVLAGAAILYDTSNVLHHYPADRHVSAALQLFASVALLFWYVLRLFMSRD